MTIPAADHPLWPTLRFAIVGVVLSLRLIYGYEQFDLQKDATTLLAVLAGLGGFDSIKAFATREKTE